MMMDLIVIGEMHFGTNNDRQNGRDKGLIDLIHYRELLVRWQRNSSGEGLHENYCLGNTFTVLSNDTTCDLYGRGWCHKKESQQKNKRM